MNRLFVLLIILLPNIVKSQTIVFDQNQYWYYRDRLKYFVYPGTEKGNSLIATLRNPTTLYRPYTTIKYGQTFKSMGYYLGVLATEYKLLVHNGQYLDAASTLAEINLALDAINRTDNCESDAPWFEKTDHLDGFFIRSDVPAILDMNMVDALNNGLNSGTFEEYIDDLRNSQKGYLGKPYSINNSCVNTMSQYESNHNYYYEDKLSQNPYWITAYNNKEDKYWEYWKGGGFTSQDEIIGIYMGLGLVAGLVDDVNTVEKARGIASRMLDFARIHPACGGNYGYSSDILFCTPYFMRYPDGSFISTNDGGLTYGFYWGIFASCAFINNTPTNYYNSYLSTTREVYAASVLLYSILNLSSGNYRYNSGLFSKLLAVSDLTGSMYISPPTAIRRIGNDFNWDHFYLMVWAVLHQKNLQNWSYYFNFNQLISDLETAPCGGPYRYIFEDGDSLYSEGWACQYKYDASIEGQTWGDKDYDIIGVFPGADYMLLYNLACLAFPNGFDYEGQHYSFPYYINLNNRIISDAYLPIILSGPLSNVEIGSVASPEELRGISSISTDMIVSNQAMLYPNTTSFQAGVNGDVTLKAGESIKLTDGFRVDAGAHFLARIESYSCGGLSYKNMAAPPWNENYRGCYYDTLISVPMEKRAPIVYSEDNYEEEDFDMPLWEDYYYMNDTTTTTELAVGAWLNPNPCGSSATLTVVSENEQQLTIELYDMTGIKRETVFNDIADQNLVLDLNLSSYASGTYMLRITGSGGVKVLRFVKE